ncbi:MAG: diaminopimelate decarboxylase [Candidatus Hydrogenedentota bacterium]
MDSFGYQNGTLHCEQVSIPELAETIGAPFYVYSKAALMGAYREMDEAFGDMDHLICYAIKANPNLTLNRLLAEAGAGAEVVSGGELYRALQAGYPPERIVFDGNAKTREELAQALDAAIYAINVDSENELRALANLAQEMDHKARAGLRVNPDVSPDTHPKIATGLRQSKFGVDLSKAVECYEFARDHPYIDAVGIHAHIGSQILDVTPFAEAAGKLVNLALELKDRDIELEYLDLGGGLGIQYEDETPPSYKELADAIRPHWERYPMRILLEPGRSLMGNIGYLVSRVLYVKESPAKRFVVIDAAMNDLWRPTMYDSYHHITPVRETQETFTADVVGGVCESGDYMARDRVMGKVSEGELIAIGSAGAYGASMSSEYNSRPLAPEALVDGSTFQVIRRRPTYDEMIRLEMLEAPPGGAAHAKSTREEH